MTFLQTHLTYTVNPNTYRDVQILSHLAPSCHSRWMLHCTPSLHPITVPHHYNCITVSQYCTPSLHHHYNHTTAPHYCTHHYALSLHHHYTPSLHHHYKPVTTNTSWYLITVTSHYNTITSTTSLHPSLHPGFVNYIFLSWNVLPWKKNPTFLLGSHGNTISYMQTSLFSNTRIIFSFPQYTLCLCYTADNNLS